MKLITKILILFITIITNSFAVITIDQISITNDSTPLFSGTATNLMPESTLTLTINSAIYENITVDENDGWSLDTGTVTPTQGSLLFPNNGQYAVVVQGINSSESNISDTHTFLLDTTAPESPTLDILSGNTDSSDETDLIVSDTSPKLEGTAEANSTVSFEFLDVNNTNITQTTNTDEGGNYSIIFEDTFKEGETSIVIKAQDEAGNISSSLTKTITVDTTADEISFSIIDTGSSLTDRKTNNNTITIEDLESTSTFQYSTTDGEVWTNADLEATSFNLSEGIYSANQVQVRTIDRANNISTPEILAPITIDLTPNIITLSFEDTGSNNDDRITNNTTITVNSLLDDSTYVYTKNGGISWKSGSNNSFEVLDNTIYDSDDIQVKTTDIAGNESEAVLLGNLTTDSTSEAIVTINDIGTIYVNTHPVFSGTNENADSDFEIIIAGATYYIDADEGGNWEINTLNAQAESGDFDISKTGTYTIEVNVKDKVGNTNTQIQSFVVKNDITIENKDDFSEAMYELNDKTINVNSLYTNDISLYINDTLVETKTPTEDDNGITSSVIFNLTSSFLELYNNSSLEIEVRQDTNSESSTEDSVSYEVKLKDLLLGVQGSAIQFGNSNDDYIELPQTINGTIEDFTIDFWYNNEANECSNSNILHKNLPNNDSSQLRISQFHYPASEGYDYEVCTVDVWLGSQSFIAASPDVFHPELNDNWNHFVITYKRGDSSNSVKMYLNGTQVGSRETDITIDTSYFNNLRLGRNNYLLDDFKIWNKALSSQEVKNLNNKQVSTANLNDIILYYTFDDGFGSNVKDYSSSNNNGTINGEVLRLNFLGDMLDFSSLSSALKVYKDENIAPEEMYEDFTNEITIGAWVYLNENSDTSSNFQILGDSKNYSLYMEPIPNSESHNYSVTLFIHNGEEEQNQTRQYDLKYNKWHYIAATFKEGTFKQYINGQEIHNEETFTNVTTITNDSSRYNNPFYIGAGFSPVNPQNTFTTLFDNLSQVSLWNKALSSEELNRIMHNYINYEDENLIAYWSLNEDKKGSNLSSAQSSLNLEIDEFYSTWSDKFNPEIVGKKIYANDTQKRYLKIYHDNINDRLTFIENSSNASILNTDYLSFTANYPSSNDNFSLGGSVLQEQEGMSQLDNNSNNINSSDYISNIQVDTNYFENKLQINISNLEIDQYEISQISLINASNLNEIDLLNSAVTSSSFTLLSKDVLFSNTKYRIKILATNESNTIAWYYNFSTKQIDSYTPEDFTNYEQSLPYKQNIIDIDLSTQNWNFISQVKPVLTNTSFDISENTREIGNVTVDNSGDSVITQYAILEELDYNYFSISSQGEITLKDDYIFDFEDKIDYSIKVTAQNSAGTSEAIEVSIQVTDVKEDASFGILLSNTSSLVNENETYNSGSLSLNSTAIGEVTYTILGSDVNYFDLNEETNTITMASKDFENPVDQNADGKYELTIIATDSDDNTASFDLSLIVQNVSEHVEYEITSIGNLSVEENSIYTSSLPTLSGGTPIGNIHYSLQGDDANLFTFDENTGAITLSQKDFENPQDKNLDNNYSIRLIATDSDQNTASNSFNIVVTNKNELVDYQIDNIGSLTVQENTAYNSDIATLTGQTPIGSVIYSIEGEDANLFNIDTSTGKISLIQKDFEDPQDKNLDNIYEVTLVATDRDNNTTNKNFSITVTNEVETASFQLINLENSIVNEQVNFLSDIPSTTGDEYIGILEYTIEGEDSSLFTINKQGILSLEAKDFENPLDSNKDNVYSVTVIAKDSDENTAEKDLSITIKNVFEEVPTLDNTVFSIDENISTQESIGELVNLNTGDSTITEFIIIGDDSEKFQIRYEENKGKIYIAQDATFDFETKDIYNLEVEVVNTLGKSSKKALIISINDLPDVLVQIDDLTINNINENTSTSSLLGTLSLKEQGDSDIIKYELEGIGSENFVVQNDGKIYISENANLNYDTKQAYSFDITAFNETGQSQAALLNINLKKNKLPTIAKLYDRYITLDSQENIIELVLNDEDSDNLNISITSTSNDLITIDKSQASISANNYNNLNLAISSLSMLGKETVTITINDGEDEISEEFDIIIEKDNRFKNNINIVEQAYFNNIETISFNVTDKFYSFENNRGQNITTDSIIYYSSYKVIDEDELQITKYNDLNGVVTIKDKITRYYVQNSDDISIYSDKNKTNLVSTIKIRTLSNSDLETILSNTHTNYTLNDNTLAYEVIVKEEDISLEILDEISYKDISYSSLNRFMSDFTLTNKLGLLRSYDRQRLLLFDSSEVELEEGSLIEVNLETNEINTHFTGTWKIVQLNGKDVLTFGDLDGYEDNVAFTLNENNKIARAKYTSNDIYTSELLLSKNLKKELYASLSANPIYKLELSDTWNYISLPSSLVLCDSSIQTSLSLCNQENSLNEIFASESIVYILKHDGTDWTYWDRNPTLQVQYGLNKFSAISQKDGLLVKLSSAITLELPFIEEDIEENSFMRLYDEGWYLTSMATNKTVQEIENIIEEKYTDKKLSSILLFKDNQWQIYSPDEDDYVDNSLKRIDSEIKNSDSFWINIEKK